MAEWEKALSLEPDNVEAGKLLDFARSKLPDPPPESTLRNERITEPVLSVMLSNAGQDGWEADEPTSRQSPSDLTAQLLHAEREAAEKTGRFRANRPTVESAIPGILAQITSPGWMPPSQREEGAPDELFPDEDTRRLGSEPHGSGSTRVPSFTDVPTSDSASDARRRASELADRCRLEYDRGSFEAAAAAAEEALKEAESVPEPGIPEVIGPARLLFERVFESYLGPTHSIPVFSMTPDVLARLDLDSRAGFLMSRGDGVMTIDHLLEIAAMPRFDALRILATLLRAKALKLL